MSNNGKVEFTPSGKEVTHATPSSYNNHGCRCPDCTKAWADYMRGRIKTYRANRKKREAEAAKTGVQINL